MSANGGWIGVDLDGTLAEYHGWDDGKIGAPVPAMVARVKAWLALGIEVRVMTARISGTGRLGCGASNCVDGYHEDPEHTTLCPKIREVMEEQERAIKAWCKEHIGQELAITCVKDFSMIELWDDRAVCVEKNTGRSARWSENGTVAVDRDGDSGYVIRP